MWSGDPTAAGRDGGQVDVGRQLRVGECDEGVGGFFGAGEQDEVWGDGEISV